MADQTNAEVSDERLATDLRVCANLADTHGMAGIAITCRAAAELLTRRSVTSQASEGEVETAFIKLCEALGIPATAAAYLEVASPSKRVERMETALDSCAARLETMAESAEARGDTVEWSMMSVMAETARQALQGGRS